MQHSGYTSVPLTRGRHAGGTPAARPSASTSRVGTPGRTARLAGTYGAAHYGRWPTTSASIAASLMSSMLHAVL